MKSITPHEGLLSSLKPAAHPRMWGAIPLREGVGLRVGTKQRGDESSRLVRCSPFALLPVTSCHR